MTNTQKLRDLIRQACPLPWTLATSNSWRRIVDPYHVPVCSPCTQSDGHPDLAFPGGAEGPTARLLIEAANALPELLDALDAQTAEIERLKESAHGFVDEIAAKDKEIARLREAQAWQPIETAPKDGTEILAWRADCGQFIASYTSPSELPISQAEIDALDEETLFAEDWFTQWPQAQRLEGSEVPTHWMPLPAGPNALSGESNG